ncbi:MAG: PEPxxWA-CTERM sorting domain-containing protein [Sandaracinobacteroides sp.]
MFKVSALLTAVGMVAIATSASAQIGPATATTTASQTLDGVTTNFPNPAPSPNYDNGGPGGAGYGASAVITSDSIFFQAGAMSAGTKNASSSSVSVSFDVTNPGAAAIDKLESTIFESNFGFFISNFSNGFFPGDGTPLPVCSGATLPGCAPVNFGGTFDDFTALGQDPRLLATTSFQFEVLQSGYATPVASVGGTMSLIRNGSTVSLVTGGGFDDLASQLNNFVQFAPPADEVLDPFGNQIPVGDYVRAYSWERTNFTADLNPILSGETSTLTYRVTTSTQNFGITSTFPPDSNLIVAFTCFADPIGRGGVRGAVLTIPGFAASTCAQFESSTDSPFFLKVPVIDGDTIRVVGGVIPEPDTWAMLILGFGLVGLSMRRSKKPAAATVTA